MSEDNDRRTEAGGEWRDWKAGAKKSKVEIYKNALEELEVLAGFHDIEIEQIQPHQLRVNKEVDLFPLSKRFHFLKTNERGTYNDADSFIHVNIKKIKPMVKAYDDETPMPWGKHKKEGLTLGEVPAQYFIWLEDQKWFLPETNKAHRLMQDYIDENREVIEQQYRESNPGKY